MSHEPTREPPPGLVEILEAAGMRPLALANLGRRAIVPDRPTHSGPNPSPALEVPSLG